MGKPPQTAQLDVLVLDRHDAGRIGLAIVLKRAEGIDRCLVAESEERALALARRHQPRVAVVDISERGAFVGALAAALREAAPGIRLVLSSRCAASAHLAVRAARAEAFVPAGASGLETVALVLGDGRPRPPEEARPGPSQLSERERQVLTLLVAGATNREIAAEIHLGPDAVKKHVSAILRKLGARNRTEAVQLAHGALLS